MNVADNLLLQQMPNMANMPKPSANSAGKEQAGSFQDMMNQQGVEADQDSSTAEQPVENTGSSAKDDSQTVSVPKKPGKKEEQIDPNAAVCAMDLFRPEIVDISQPEAEAEVSIEIAAPEVAADVPVDAVEMEAAVPEMEVPVQEDAPVVQEVPKEEFRQTVEQTAVPEAVAPERPVETEKPVETVRDTGTDTVEKTVDVRETQNVRPTEETSEDTNQETAVDVNSQPVFHEVEAAPVKVAENFQRVDTEAPDMDEKLAASILDAAQNGAEKIEIQLNPANLGALTIQLTKDSEGVLEVVIHTATNKAAGLLSQHLDGLHSALQSYGSQQTVHVEVQRGQESQQQHMFQHADPDGRGQHQRHQQENRREEQESSEDFMQKLRLGLTGLEE